MYGKWVGRCIRKSWELISPDVTFCLRGMFSPLLLGFRAPFAPDTRITVARALNIHTSSTPSFSSTSPSLQFSLLSYGSRLCFIEPFVSAVTNAVTASST